MALVDEQRHDEWIEVRLNRPQQRNALSTDLADELVGSIRAAETWAHGMVLAANGPAFCAGADLKEGVSLSPERPSSRIIRALIETPLFVVAAVEAGVYGAGLSMLAACPVVLATPSATLSLPEAKRGFFPLGVAPYLERWVPPRRLLELGVAAGTINATEALEWGLFTEVVEPDRLSQRGEAWMARVIAEPRVAWQAKMYWVSDLRSPEFQERTERLEALLIQPGARAEANGHIGADVGLGGGQ